VQEEWHRAWVAELPTLADAEAWIAALTAAGRAEVYSQQLLLARKHAPDYFASWASEGGDGAGDGAKL